MFVCSADKVPQFVCSTDKVCMYVCSDVIRIKNVCLYVQM